MWNLFRKRETAKEKAGEDELRAELRSLEARVKGLETEWASVYQKVTRAVGHITKATALEKVSEKVQAEPLTRNQQLESLTRDELARLL